MSPAKIARPTAVVVALVFACALPSQAEPAAGAPTGGCMSRYATGFTPIPPSCSSSVHLDGEQVTIRSLVATPNDGTRWATATDLAFAAVPITGPEVQLASGASIDATLTLDVANFEATVEYYDLWGTGGRIRSDWSENDLYWTHVGFYARTNLWIVDTGLPDGGYYADQWRFCPGYNFDEGQNSCARRFTNSAQAPVTAVVHAVVHTRIFPWAPFEHVNFDTPDQESTIGSVDTCAIEFPQPCIGDLCAPYVGLPCGQTPEVPYGRALPFELGPDLYLHPWRGLARLGVDAAVSLDVAAL